MRLGGKISVHCSTFFSRPKSDGCGWMMACLRFSKKQIEKSYAHCSQTETRISRSVIQVQGRIRSAKTSVSGWGAVQRIISRHDREKNATNVKRSEQPAHERHPQYGTPDTSLRISKPAGLKCKGQGRVSASPALLVIPETR